MNDWLTPNRAAEALGWHITTVYKALEAGELHGHQRKAGGRWQIHRDVIGAHIRSLDQHTACGCPRLKFARSA